MRKPNLGEIARDDHGIAMAKAFTAILLENPDTVMLQRGRDFTLYDELLRDDQVKATFQQRRSAVTSCDWVVDPASDSPADVAAADHLREQLGRLPWDVITDRMLYAIFYGFSVAEMMWTVADGKVEIADIRVRDRGRFKFDTDNALRLADVGHPQGLILPEHKFWLFQAGASHSDNPYGLGLGHSLYWPVFFKRNDIKFWLIFLEKFGMPTTTGRLPGGKIDIASERNKALQALQAIQTDSAVVIPDDMTIELIEAARSGTADYSELYERMDKAISKVVLSQTMTTDDGSSNSQAQVHKGVVAAVIDSDADMLCESFNAGPAQWLTAWNFPAARPPRVWRNTQPEEDRNQRAERDTKIHALGYEPTEQYIEEQYGPGWRKQAAPAQPPNDPAGPLPAEFQEISDLAQSRAGHRADQQALVDGAEYLGSRYQELYGQRIEQILSYLEDTSDVDTFRRQLTSMLTDPPSIDAVDSVRNATWMARLMGVMRGQRAS